MKSVERIHSHFEQEAKVYDDIIIKLIPEYKKMISILLEFINFAPSDTFSVIDLGCGTGTLSKAVKDTFPNAEITCLDISKKMLEITKGKVGPNTTLLEANFYEFVFPRRFDVIVSSLALHHLESDGDKLAFYKKIHHALNTGGIFLNIDVVNAANDTMQKVYMNHWKNFMLQNMSSNEIENNWLPKYYDEDRPASLVTHFKLLEQSGFCSIDCAYKSYNYAVYSAQKTAD